MNLLSMPRALALCVLALLGGGGTALLGFSVGDPGLGESPGTVPPGEVFGSMPRLGLAGREAGQGPASTPGVVAGPPPQEDGPEYNGQFTYVRLSYGESGSDLRNMRFYRSGRRGRGAPWSHDYPRAEVNFSKILDATTYVDTYMQGNAGRILSLDDPELFRYPMATLIEPGYWRPSEAQVEHLRAYLLKGGFLVFDDFRGEWELRNLLGNMSRVLPGYGWEIVPDDHEIFNSFFRIEDPLSLVPPYGRQYPQYLGFFEDNDVENGRLMVMINYNQDLQEYWEYSDRGYYPIDLSNDAYKFGVNYVIYAFTH